LQQDFHLQNTIEIENAQSGEAQRTSHKRALYYRKTGQALIIGPDSRIIVEATVPRDAKLRFLRGAEIARRRNEERERDILKAHRGDVVHWNGSADPLAQRRPGEVRS
jgi:hypothetical protein